MKIGAFFVENRGPRPLWSLIVVLTWPTIFCVHYFVIFIIYTKFHQNRSIFVKNREPRLLGVLKWSKIFCIYFFAIFFIKIKIIFLTIILIQIYCYELLLHFPSGSSILGNYLPALTLCVNNCNKYFI